MAREKRCVSSKLRDCCLVLLKKWKYMFSACYNRMMMERSQCRGGGCD